MNPVILLIVILLILAIAGAPRAGLFVTNYGYYPSGVIVLVAVVLVVLLLMNKL